MGDWLGRRLLCSMGGLVSAMLGMILMIALPLSNNTGRLISYYMTNAGAAPFVALLSLISSNVAGYTKKTTVAAVYLIAYCVGNIIGLSLSLSSLVNESILTAQAPKHSAPKTRRATCPPRSRLSSATACACSTWRLYGGGTTGRTRRRPSSARAPTTRRWRIKSTSSFHMLIEYQLTFSGGLI
jgi:hypothetical protein